ncbi:MAG: hypothetical protein QXT73_00430 [Candidatus Methanomethylicaceae archaeon]
MPAPQSWIDRLNVYLADQGGFLELADKEMVLDSAFKKLGRDRPVKSHVDLIGDGVSTEWELPSELNSGLFGLAVEYPLLQTERSFLKNDEFSIIDLGNVVKFKFLGEVIPVPSKVRFDFSTVTGGDFSFGDSVAWGTSGAGKVITASRKWIVVEVSSWDLPEVDGQVTSGGKSGQIRYWEADQCLRLFYFRPYLDYSEVPTNLIDPCVKLAAALGFRLLAARFAQNKESLIGADVASGRDMVASYLALARDYERAYEEEIGKRERSTRPINVMKDWDLELQEGKGSFIYRSWKYR